MIQWVKGLCLKYKGLILYGIFGVLTTVLNIVVYYVCARVIGIPMAPSNAIAWVLSVAFAYITNRKWVFESTVAGFLPILREIAGFVACRVLTGLMDMGIMFVFADWLRFDDMIVKVTSNVLVIIGNYVGSKLVVFAKKP